MVSSMLLSSRRPNSTFVFFTASSMHLLIDWQRVVGYIEAGKAEGATLVTGGERQGNEGYYIEPTLFADTKPDMKIVKEEIFGPVGILIKFKTEEGWVLQ